MFTRVYWLDLAERAAASFAGGALAALGGDVVNLWDVDWRAMLGLGAGAALVSVLKGLAARLRGNPESASLLTLTAGPAAPRHANPVAAQRLRSR